MAAPLRRGVLILFEGVDRCGKTTQARLLVDALNRHGHAVFMRFPDRETPIGRIINEYLMRATELDDRAIHLLFAANRWERRKDIMEALMAGTHVVMDRYAYSGVAFSSAKPGLDIEWCKHADVGLPMPDAVLFMDISVAAAAKRGGFGRERYESLEMQSIVRTRFDALRVSTEAAVKGVWHHVDADGTVEDVQAKIMAIVELLIKHVSDEGMPVRTLWEGAEMKLAGAEGNEPKRPL